MQPNPLLAPENIIFKSYIMFTKKNKTHMHLGYKNWGKYFVTLWKWFFSTFVMPAQLKLYTHTSLHRYLEDWWLRLFNLNNHKTTNKKQGEERTKMSTIKF